MSEIKNWLEIVYFLSGPAITLIAYLALGQIRVAKEQIIEQKKALRVSSKRDALKLTAEQVTLYCDKIIPLQNILDRKIKAEGIDFLEKFQVVFSADSIKLIPPKENIDYSTFAGIATELVGVANALESFSTYFISGVADEELAYLSLGSTFCKSMKKIAPILIPVSDKGKNYSAAFKLYSIWGSRFESEDLGKQKAEIEKKLQSKKHVSVNVLGVEA